MKRWLLAPAVLLVATTTAYGDGGAMLLHQDAGPFTVTVFAAPQPLHVGAADISVMVQDRSSGDVLLDPAVDVTLSRGSSDQQPALLLSSGHAGNRLLQAATVSFPRAGLWQLGITVQRGRDRTQLTARCKVEPDHSRTALLWFYCLLPVAVIVLFAIQQRLKSRSVSPGLW